MSSRFTKGLLSLAAVAALSVPAIAQARGGSDDPANHVRREHHRVAHHLRHHRSDDGARQVKQAGDDRGGQRGGNDDGPNHT